MQRPGTFLIVVSLISLAKFIFTERINCDNFDCKNIQCGSLQCAQNYVSKSGLTDPCGCCNGCIRYKQINEICNPNSSPKLEAQCPETFTSDECDEKKLLTCDIFSNVCVQTKADKIKHPCFARLDDYNEEEKKSDWFWKANCTEGKFSPKQCKRDSCFCNTENGQRLYGSFTEEEFDSTNCKCSLMEAKLDELASVTGRFDHVNCKHNGNFDVLQCLSGMCFCMNETNGEIVGIVVPQTVVHLLPCYDKVRFSMSTCQNQRQIEERIASYYFLKGMKFEYLSPIRCNPDGSYVAKQCEGDRCFCVNPANGGKIKNYEVSSRSPAALTMNCRCLLDMVDQTSEGGSVQGFFCASNGNYKKAACHGKICYCLDEDGQRDSAEVDISQWYGNFCNISNQRVRKCYIESEEIDCSDPASNSRR